MTALMILLSTVKFSLQPITVLLYSNTAFCYIARLICFHGTLGLLWTHLDTVFTDLGTSFGHIFRDVAKMHMSVTIKEAMNKFF
jgi:hypothetical protein